MLPGWPSDSGPAPVCDSGSGLDCSNTVRGTEGRQDALRRPLSHPQGKPVPGSQPSCDELCKLGGNLCLLKPDVGLAKTTLRVWSRGRNASGTEKGDDRPTERSALTEALRGHVGARRSREKTGWRDR